MRMITTIKVLHYGICLAVGLATACGALDDTGSTEMPVAVGTSGGAKKPSTDKNVYDANAEQAYTGDPQATYEDFCDDEARRNKVALWEDLIYALYLAPYDGLTVGHGSLSATASNPTVDLQCKSLVDKQVAACEKKASGVYTNCINAGHGKPGPWTDWAACQATLQSDTADCETESEHWASELTLSLDLQVGDQLGNATISSSLELSSTGGYCTANVTSKITGFGPFVAAGVRKMINEKFPAGERSCMGSN